MKKSFRSAIVAYLLAMAVVLVTTSVPAFAREGGDAELAVEPAAVTETVDVSVPGNDELLAGYIEQRFAEQLPAADDGEPELTAQSAGEALTGNTALAYELVKAEIEKIAAGEQGHESTVVEFELERLNDLVNKRFSPADYGLDSFLGEEGYTDEGWTVIQDQILGLNFRALVNALLHDCPYELYWYDKTEGFESNAPVGIYPNGDCVVTSATCSVSFTVAQAYAAGKYDMDTTKISCVPTAVANAAQIVAKNADKSAYGKMLEYKNTICDWVSYNDEAAEDIYYPYGDPWQLVYVFDGDASTNVVCEGYSKAFKYLCDLSQLHGAECLLVSGKLGEGVGAGDHMWNVVKMYDGKSYLVDVTNCDEGSIGAPDALFFKAPTSGSAATGYQFVIDDHNKTSYAYDDGSEPYSTSMWSLYSNEELTLADTSFDPLLAGNLADATITVEDVTYTGSDLTPALVVVLHGTTLVAGEDYTVTYANNKNAGTATVTVAGTGDFTGTKSAEFTVNPKVVTPEVSLSATSFTYTGAVQQPEVTLGEVDGVALSEDDYALAWPDGCVDVGTYELTVTLVGNYEGTKTVAFDITARDISNATVTLEQDSFTYDGTAFEPAAAVELDGLPLSADAYDVTYAGNTNVGKATVTVTGKGNYTGTATASFDIAARDLSDAAVTLERYSFTYDGTEHKPGVTVALGEQELAEGADYTLAYVNNTSAGTATATVTGTGNYTGEVTADFEIAKAAQVITASDVSTPVRGAVALDATVLDSAELSYLSADEAIATVSDTGVVTGVGEGTTTITITAAETANYAEATKPIEVTVAGVSLADAVVSVSPRQFTYDGKAKEPTVTVSLDGTPLAEGTDFTVVYTNNKNAGTATATVEGVGTYVGTVSATFTIAKAKPTITASNKEVVTKKSIKLGATVTKGAGRLTYASSKKTVATVSSAGVVKGLKVGTVKVTITSAETANFKAATKTVTVKVGKANSMAVKAKAAKVSVALKTVSKKAVVLANNVKFTEKAQGAVAYANASTNATAKKFKVAAKTGKVTVPKDTKKGTYVVKLKVTAKGNKSYISGTKTVTFKVVVK